MPSPFPGMDPYLEQYWREVHHRLCTYACDVIQPQVRPKLLARLDERLVVEVDGVDEPPRIIVPDVRIEEFRGGTAVAAGVLVAENEPLVFRVTRDEPAHEAFIEIVDPAHGHRLITVIEILSPSNKRRGPDRDRYQQKQEQLRLAGVSLVEVDLIRSGVWTLQPPARAVARKRQAPFNVCVRRGWLSTGAVDVYEVYAVQLNQVLPKVRIPLRQRDADAVVDLQALLTQAYDNGPYADLVDYAADADPPLTGDAAAWADGLLRVAGRRN